MIILSLVSAILYRQSDLLFGHLQKYHSAITAYGNGGPDTTNCVLGTANTVNVIITYSSLVCGELESAFRVLHLQQQQESC